MDTLIVFDIDGTLLHSVAPHQAAFLGALDDSGLAGAAPALSGYAHHTDSHIFREIFRRRTGRLPDTAESHAFAGRLRERYVAATGPGGAEQVPGAAAFLRRLAGSGRYAVAFATGGLPGVTAAKLAPLAPDGVVATAGEHTFREHVVREAVHRAGGPFDRVIAVGDGPWDVRAAVALGTEFIGIGASTAPFGDWFPCTHLFASFDAVDPDADFRLAPPAGAVPEPPDAATEFTPGPDRCGCWD